MDIVPKVKKAKFSNDPILVYKEYRFYKMVPPTLFELLRNTHLNTGYVCMSRVLIAVFVNRYGELYGQLVVTRTIFGECKACNLLIPPAAAVLRMGS